MKNLNSVGISGVSGLRLEPSETDYLQVSPATFVVGEEAEVLLTYRVGNRPLEAGDSIHLQFPAAGKQKVSSKMMWSIPQAEDPTLPGYFTLHSGDPEKLHIITKGFNWLSGIVYIHITGNIPPAEELVFSYRGSVQKIARSFRFKCYRNDRLLNTLPEVNILPGRTEYILAVLPTTKKTGDKTRAALVALDRYGNLDQDFDGIVYLRSSDPGCEGLPSRYQFSARDSGRGLLDDVVFHTSGFQKITASTGEREFQSNYCFVSEENPGRSIYFGDLQFHSGTVTDTISYGLGDHHGGYNSEEASYGYMRDVMRMDFAAATEHAYYKEFMNDVWRRSKEISSQFNNPGSFTTFYGFEWHSSDYGHRIILYPGPGEPFFSCSDPTANSLDKLWDKLKGRECLIIPHPMKRKAPGKIHPIWQRTNNQLERLSEIFSNKTLRDTVTAPANPQTFEVDENETCSMQYAWKTGHMVGVVGGSDDHLGHPGLDNVSEYITDSGGITGAWAERNDRQSLWRSLKNRHTYGTSGPRVYLELRIGDNGMGDVIPAVGSREVTVRGKVAGTAPLAKVEIVHFDGNRFSSIDIAERTGEDISEFTLPVSVAEGQLLYLRVTQKDGEMAWSSPVWFEKGSTEH